MFSRPIKWESFAPTPGGLRVYYTVSGTSRGPNYDLDHADVVETENEITVWLSELVPEERIEPLLALRECVELRLKAPVGERTVRDGTTERVKPRHAPAEDHPSLRCHDWRHRRPKKRRK